MSFQPSGTPSSSTQSTITQAAHGFTVGQWVYLNGSAYTLTDADTSSATDSVGVVAVVVDANSFTLTTTGKITGLSGLTAGSSYYIDGTTAGAITTTQPTVNAKHALIADSTTSGWVQQYAGSAVANVLSYAQLEDHSADVSGPGVNIYQVTSSNANTIGTLIGSGLRATLTGGTNSSSGITIATNTLTVDVAGTYVINATFSGEVSNNAAIYTQIVKNGATILAVDTQYPGATGTQISTSPNYTGIFAAGDTIDFRHNATTAGTISIHSMSVNMLQVGASPVPMDLAGEYGNGTISMADGTSITTTAADVGTVTLPTAGTYRLFATMAAANWGTTTSNTSFFFTDSSNVEITGSRFSCSGFGGLGNVKCACSQQITVTVTASTTYKVRVEMSSSTSSFVNETATGTSSTISYVKVSGFLPTTGTTVDYGQYHLSASLTPGASADITGFVADSGNIATDGTSFSLTAGKTYEVTSNMSVTGIGVSEIATYSWVDSVNANIVAGSNQGSLTTTAATLPSSIKGSVTFIYTPSVDTSIKMRSSSSNNTTYQGGTTFTNNAASTVTIKQLGSTDNTVGTLPANDQSSAGYFDIGNMRMAWGKTVTVGDGDQAISFGVTFATPPTVTCTQDAGTGTIAAYGYGIGSITTTGFTGNRDDSIADADDAPVNWVAIGSKP